MQIRLSVFIRLVLLKKGNYRDILFISFISAPEKINIDKDDFFYYEEKYPKAIWGDTEEVVNITKPQSLKKTIKLFFKYYKNKSI